MEEISFEDWSKLDIRIGKVLKAEKVEGTDKLMKLEIDIGNEERQVVAGIADVYKTEDLIGREIPILLNLKAKAIKGVESKGMILAVVVDEKAVLLHPEKEVPVGSKVR